MTCSTGNVYIYTENFNFGGIKKILKTRKVLLILDNMIVHIFNAC